ncbi:MFS transporter [Actinomycetospora endophytica]|uniref:MFS transporter n=1 Tax=Actinomycetospora endophytica TaxID=2291215 RepID=A0ABS8PEN5_9PSEU|nr:MFS transporter [Actinomycetospora endophytica]MCD2195965.1 MFS transporter [Actinomycetospora endophytica]
MTATATSAIPVTTRPRLALVALSLAFFAVQLDATVVNVALETISRDLGGGIGAQQWVVAAYTVALAAGMLTAGSLGDRHGARRVCVLGLVVFGLASAGCALAPGAGWLVAARVAQGLGAAGLLPSSLALIVGQFPDPARRAGALGVWGGVGSLGMATGPLLGGTLIAVADWRWIFLVNVPVCVATVVLTRLAVAESPRREHATDVVGLVLGVVALGALTGGLIEAGQLGWTDPLPLGLVGAGLLGAVLFVLAERRRAEPMLPMTMFSARPFSGGVAAGGIFNFCLYGALLAISLFLQGPLGQDAFHAGLLLLPLTLAVGIGSTLSARLTARVGSRPPMLAGYAMGALGTAILAVAGPTGPVALVVVGATVLGFCSIAMPAMTAVTMGGVDPAHTGLGSGVLNTARQAGGALGAAVCGSLLTATGIVSLTAPMVAALLAYHVAIGATLVATGTGTVKIGKAPRAGR